MFSGYVLHSAVLGCCPYAQPSIELPALCFRNLWRSSFLRSGTPTPKFTKPFPLSLMSSILSGKVGGKRLCCTINKMVCLVLHLSQCDFFPQLNWDLHGATEFCLFLVSFVLYKLCPINTINWLIDLSFVTDFSPFPRCLEEGSHSWAGPSWFHNSG